MTSDYEALESGVATRNDTDSNTVHGVAIGENDTTRGGSGKTTQWPPEVLQEAAEMFEGIPIVKDHPNIEKTGNGLKITGHAPIDSKVGEIKQAKYKPGVGVLWEGEITDEEMLQKVEDGIAEVSPVLQRELEQVDENTYKATEIKAVRDLGLVSRGASPSNSIDTGAAAMSAEALAQEFANEDVADTSNAESGDEIQGAEALKSVAGVSFTGTKTGKLDKSAIESDFGDHFLYGSGDDKSDYSYPVVDADGNLRKGNVDSAWGLGCRGKCPSDETHDEKLMALADEFENPPEWAENGESMGAGVANPGNWEACSVEPPEQVTVTLKGDESVVEYVDATVNDTGGNSGADSPQHDDGAQEDKPQSSVAGTSEETMSENELTETETAVLEAADSLEEPVEALEEYAAMEQPEVVEQDKYESLQENVNEVRDVLSEALSERTELKESTVEALGFDALCDEFRDDEGELQVEALTQNPETGEPEEEVEALSDDADMDKAEALYGDYQRMSRPPEGLEEDITEALGVSDFEEATEVLE